MTDLTTNGLPTLPITPGAMPCPFCGSEDVYAGGHDHPHAVVAVRCNGCGAEGPVVPVDHTFTRTPKGAEAMAKWAEEGRVATQRAVERWNGARRSRTQPSAVVLVRALQQTHPALFRADLDKLIQYVRLNWNPDQQEFEYLNARQIAENKARSDFDTVARSERWMKLVDFAKALT